ncbi:protein DpdH [Micromonospora sp. 050-3]|uniref:protein DpdH n=1 Tax=Micromonospora sp. 050-3 TaxID=2789265 RepID=UPI00397866E3
MTESFPGYVCWSRTDVADTINTEAVHADPAVFLATHRPLAVVRQAWGSSEPGEKVDEHTVLDDFTNRPPTGGIVLMPIMGESGTGKSHLVRWVQQQLHDTSKRRVIYLRKTETSLSSLIRTLLADLQGQHFQDIRDRVSRTLGQYDEQALPHELLDRLALVLQFADFTGTATDSTAARYRKALSNERALPALLRDYGYRRHLLAPDSVITRFATELLHGRRSGDGDRRTAFEPEDLLPDVDPGEIGPIAAMMYKQLLGSPALREEAAKLLSENLDRAVLRLTDLEGGRLTEAMIEIRREFQRRGQEIILLIEDFALIQGIQRDLLEAITEAGVREGQQELATVRTLMAVTRGYFFEQLPETARTRAEASVPYMYKLDVPMSDKASIRVDDQQIVDFVARYLNAARAGRSNLLRAHERAGRQAALASSRWVPNGCSSCTFRSQCHEAFGLSSEGFGLYPFNKPAIVRAVRVTSDRDAKTFNPRTVLSRVVRYVLDNYDNAIREGEFPPRTFRRDFPRRRLLHVLGPELATRLQAADPEYYERRLDLLEFWGDHVAGNLQLPAGVQTAFRLPLLQIREMPAHQPQRRVVPNPSPEEQSSIAPQLSSGGPIETGAGTGTVPPKALQARLKAVDDWYGRDTLLAQDYARDLRTWLRDAVVARMPWNELGLPTPNDTIRRALFGDKVGVYIERAFGDKGEPPQGKAYIVLKKEPATATMLKAIFQREEYGHWNFSGGPEQQRILSRRLDEWAEAMVQATRDRFRFHDGETIAAAVATLLVGARLLDIKGSRGRVREDLVAALFHPGPQANPATHTDADVRTAQWTDLARKHLDDRAELVKRLSNAVGAAQGDGAPQLIDVTALLPAIETFVASPALKVDPQVLPEWIGPWYGRLQRGFDAAVHAQWVHLQTLVVEYRRLTGENEPDVLLNELQEAVAVLPTVAPGAGGRSPEEWLDGLRQARRLPWEQWQDLLKEFDEVDTAPKPGSAGENERRSRLVAKDRGKNFGAVLQFLTDCERWLDDGLRKANHQRSAQPADPYPELRQVLADIDKLLSDGRESGHG